MDHTKSTKAGTPIEVFLTQQNLEVICLVVHDDETTDSLDVNSLSMRGAMREISGYLIKQGYAAVGRWEETTDSGGELPFETVRRFRAKDVAASETLH